MSGGNWQDYRAGTTSSASGGRSGASHDEGRNRLGDLPVGTNTGGGSMPRSVPTPEADPGYGGVQSSWSGGIWGNPPSRTFGGPGHDGARSRDERSQLGTASATAASQAPMGSGSLLSSSETDDWRTSTATIWRTRSTPSPAVSQPSSHQPAAAPARPTGATQQQLAGPAYLGTPLPDPAVRSPFRTSLSGPSLTSLNVPVRAPGSASASGGMSAESPDQPRRARLSGNAKPFQAPSGFSDAHGRPTTAYPDPGDPYRSVGSSYTQYLAGSRGTATFEGENYPSTRSDTSSPTFSRYVPSGSGGLASQPLQASTSLPPSRPAQAQLDPRPVARPAVYTQGNFSGGARPRDFPTNAPLAHSDFTSSPTHRLPQTAGPPLSLSTSRLPPPMPHEPQSNVQASPRSLRSWGPTEPDLSYEALSLPPEVLPDAAFTEQLQSLRSSRLSTRGSASPSGSSYRRSLPSPYVSTGATPATEPDQLRAPSRGAHSGRGFSDSHSLLLSRKLRGLQQEQQGYMGPQMGPQMGPVFGAGEAYMNQFAPPPYGVTTQHQFGLNAMAQYLPALGMWSESLQQRSPARDREAAHPRSPLLEEFRSNAKTNKRYEVKDIYGHIVEFSGDQLGSRFIQLKLETANTEEKERIFQEILPNSVQLMKDVFGNYVVQKFFDHGTQHQKTVLAEQMKGQMLALSLQTYGCRVVQKALEHVLVDQQASLIKDLDSHVLECVQDQNGNHVIQKAIERIPLKHIRFIIDAFVGQVNNLATHPYGCRVIQRMLEFGNEEAQRRILDELFAAGTALIDNQYGNYVAQHIIEHGRDEDRERIIEMVTAQLLHFSRHKFASNVVEKSIEFGTDAQRKEFLTIFTTVSPDGESPLQLLMSDQFGNYVIQKLLAQVKGADHDKLVQEIEPQLATLKRSSYGRPYGKQITAIERHIQKPLTTSEQTTSAAAVAEAEGRSTGDVQGPSTAGTSEHTEIAKSESSASEPSSTTEGSGDAESPT